MRQKVLRRRLTAMLIGVFFIGTGVAGYRLGSFGTDAFTCMNLGISGYIRMTFGTWQLLLNIALLILVYITARENIGIGTIVNMVCTGYIADFYCWLVLSCLHITPGLGLRIVFLAVGVFCCAFGVAMSIEANIGLAPYDSIAFVIHNISGEKMTFRTGRVAADVLCVIIGVLFCLAGHNPLREIIGIGTLINAFFNGPMIQAFKDRLMKKAAIV